MAIKNFDGEAILLNGTFAMRAGVNGQPIKATWKDLILDALSQVQEEDRKAPISQRRERAELLTRISKGGDIELSGAELTAIDNAVSVSFGNYQVIAGILELTKV